MVLERDGERDVMVSSPLHLEQVCDETGFIERVCNEEEKVISSIATECMFAWDERDG